MKCGKCSSDIQEQCNALTCAMCKESYHPACTRVNSIDNFKKLSVQKKSVWKCDLCKHESNQELVVAMESVIRGLKTDLTAQISKVNDNVEDIIGQLKSVNVAIAKVKATVETLETENESRKSEVITMRQENEELRGSVRLLQEQVKNMEQYSRRDNLEIVGVPYSKGENVYFLLEKFAGVIRLKFNRWEISTAHRLPVTKERPNPPIIVKFVARDCKYIWLSAARECRKRLTAAELSDSWPSTSIYVNDHLIPLYKAILGRAGGWSVRGG